jgi:hypothetical protein
LGSARLGFALVRFQLQLVFQALLCDQACPLPNIIRLRKIDTDLEARTVYNQAKEGAADFACRDIMHWRYERRKLKAARKLLKGKGLSPARK